MIFPLRGHIERYSRRGYVMSAIAGLTPTEATLVSTIARRGIVTRDHLMYVLYDMSLPS
mgnify:CR=1 FL=1